MPTGTSSTIEKSLNIDADRSSLLLRSLVNDYIAEIEASYRTAAIAKQIYAEAQIQGVKDWLHEQLLAKYAEIYSCSKLIQWNRVNIIGWPKEVLFYSKALWTEEDCRHLVTAIDWIKFELSTPSPSERVSLKQKEDLKAELLRLSEYLFGSPEIAWRRIKQLCPELTLKNTQILKCSDQDFRNLEAAV